MAKILNSTGLVVEVLEEIPATAGTPWGPVGYTGTTLSTTTVTTQLRGSVASNLGSGTFSLENKMSGLRGSVQVSFLAGTADAQRTLIYLTDSLSSLANRIAIGLDGMNRPFVTIYSGLGTLVGAVSPTFGSIREGAQGLVLLSWDSTAAIDGNRYARFLVNGTAVASADWMTNPTASWTSFRPSHLVLGFGVGGDLDFNGKIQSVQVSNDTVQGASPGQFPTNRVFDRFLSDSVVGSTT